MNVFAAEHWVFCSTLLNSMGWAFIGSVVHAAPQHRAEVLSQEEAVNLSSLQGRNGGVSCKCKKIASTNFLNPVWKSLQWSGESDAQLRRDLIAFNLYGQVVTYSCNVSFLWLLPCRYQYSPRFTIESNVFQLLLVSMSIFLATEHCIWVTVDVIRLGSIWNIWFLKKRLNFRFNKANWLQSLWLSVLCSNF